MSRKTMLSGTTALIAGLAMLGLALSLPGRAAAGNQQVPCDATATATPDQIGVIGNLQPAPSETPVPTCTPVRLKTHTPTTTPTEAATQTAVPVTPAPTQPAPPTATNPAGGSEGGGVRPPSTGTGAATATRSGVDVWLLVAGLTLAIAGGGTVASAAARRAR